MATCIVAPVQVAVDAVPRDAARAAAERFDRQVEHAPRIVAPTSAASLSWLGGKAEDGLAAAAAGRAPADALGFEQRDA